MIHHDLEIPKTFQGARYDHERDFKSLSSQLRAIYEVLANGEWMTVQQVAQAVSKRLNRPVLETSISANVRNLRKCGLDVQWRREKGKLSEYRMETDAQRRLF